MREYAPLSRRAFLGAATLGGAALALSPQVAFADPTAADKQAEAESALNQLNAMQEKLHAAEASYNSALEEQIAAQTSMDECQGRIDEASAQIADLQGKLGTRVRSMYRTGSSTIIDLLLGSTSFQAFTTNWDLLNSMNENDADMVQQTKDLRAEVEEQRAVYAEQERIASDKADEMAAVVAESESLVTQQQSIYDNLSAEAAALLAQEQAAREEAARRAAEEELARQQQQQQQQNSSNGGGNSSNSGGGSNSSSNGSSNSGSASNGGGGSSNTNNSKPQTVTGNVVVDRAYAQLGKPYVYGAVGPNSFDCSGLVGYCLTGRFSRWCTTGTIIGWTRVTNPQPGDICVIHNSSKQHTGIYIGGGQMIHASSPGVGVVVGSVQSGMVYVRY